jgi:transglutaminase-like putative cysteine protease
MMRPREGHGLHLEKCSIKVSVPHQIRWKRDQQENNVGLIDFTSDAQELVIEGEFVVRVCEENPFNFIIAPEASEYPFSYEHDLGEELLPLSRNLYVRDVDQIADSLQPLWHPGKIVGTLELLQQLNLHLYRTISYQRRMDKGVQSPAETLELSSGSCRDFATLFIETCRYLGIAARFVSGYMYSPNITGRMSMHGWAEVFLPGAGWIGFDPSWGILAASQYIPVAVSRHPEHVPPISGTYMGTPKAFITSEVDLYVRQFSAVLAG